LQWIAKDQNRVRSAIWLKEIGVALDQLRDRWRDGSDKAQPIPPVVAEQPTDPAVAQAAVAIVDHEQTIADSVHFFHTE
jgi:hypothetical protein